MQYSADSRSHGWAMVAAATGAGAFTLPLIAPWYLLLLAAGTAAGFIAFRSVATRAGWAVVCVAVIYAVLTGGLSPVLAASAISATALFVHSVPALGWVLLGLNITLVSTVQDLAAAALAPIGLEAIAPSLLAVAAILLIQPRLFFSGMLACVLSVLTAWGAAFMTMPPFIGMAAAGVAPCLLAVLAARSQANFSTFTPFWPIATVVAAAIMAWAWAPPRSWSDVFVLLPKAPEAREAIFFAHYEHALRLVGVDAKLVESPESVPHGSLLILPWLTSPFTTEPEHTHARRLGELARERRWTVLVAGEHTDFGGSATRIELMTGKRMLRHDLTVPPNNTDHSGPLHVADPRAWPAQAILNRGASVRATSLADRVLLAGDGWWAEPDIREWLWVGDYQWRPGDRAGRLGLAVAADIAGARWIVLGDNSMIINSQVVADPRPLLRLLEMATLWPAFLKDITIATMILALFLCTPSYRFRTSLSIAAAGSPALMVLAVTVFTSSQSAGWRDTYVGQSGFDERNFNQALAAHPALTTGRRLIRIGHPISGPMDLPDGDMTVFALIDGEARIGPVKFDTCRRVGSIATDEGAYLMDAQACRIDGPARVLVGTSQAAAAVAVPNGDGEAIVVLDLAFLSRRAPNMNALFLINQAN